MNAPTVQLHSSANGRHIGEIFFRRVEELSARTFIKLQNGSGWEEISWRDFGSLVRNILLALYALGLAAGESIAIIGENSLQRACADLATLAGGFPNVVIAPALSDGMLLRVLAHAKCRAAFVENAVAVGRLLNLQGRLPALSHIFVMEEAGVHLPSTIAFAELVEKGRRGSAERLANILESVHAHDLATIMYTSGSTGEPKGVMRTQDNLLSNITNGGEIIVSRPDDLFVIVLSLNHLLGRFGFLKSAVTGRTTAIIKATEMDLDLKVVESLAGTAMAMVPRVMQRIWNGLLDQEDNRQRWEMIERLDRKNSADGLGAADREKFDVLVSELKKTARQALGGRIKYISYGGAAMPPRIMRFFELIGIPLIGAYGSTECGGVTLCGIGENRPGNLGKPFPNVEVRIAEDAEILVRGPTVSPGYFENPEATREVFRLGRLVSHGRLGCPRSRRLAQSHRPKKGHFLLRGRIEHLPGVHRASVGKRAVHLPSGLARRPSALYRRAPRARTRAYRRVSRTRRIRSDRRRYPSRAAKPDRAAERAAGALRENSQVCRYERRFSSRGARRQCLSENQSRSPSGRAALSK